MDESQSPNQPFTGQPQPNALSGIMQGQQQPTQITKQQLIAGLHHLGSFQKEFAPLLNNPATGKTNIRPKIFDASASLIGQQVMTVPEVMNGIKDLPEEPLAQKKWLEAKLMGAAQAEKKLIQDYISQGPGQEQGPDWSMDNHKDHMTGLMGNYRRA